MTGSMIVGLIVMIVVVIALLIAVYKGLDTFVGCCIAACLVCLGCRLPVYSTMMGTFWQGASNILASMGFCVILSVLLGQVYLRSGAAESIGNLFHVVNDIERIGDHAENVADAARTRIETGVTISKEAQRELGQMLDMVNEIYRLATETFKTGRDTNIDRVTELEDKIDDMERQLQANHVSRLTKNECTPEAGMIFSDVVSGLERVADHSTNIAYSILKDKEA